MGECHGSDEARHVFQKFMRERERGGGSFGVVRVKFVERRSKNISNPVSGEPDGSRCGAKERLCSRHTHHSPVASGH